MNISCESSQAAKAPRMLPSMQLSSLVVSPAVFHGSSPTPLTTSRPSLNLKIWDISNTKTCLIVPVGNTERKDTKLSSKV